jgi:catechol 2,3-dioxygenase-like lactoylglutathione lyase family enzyme
MPTLSPAIPILRTFDERKAHEFYVTFLGFTIDWDHRFAPGMPLYLQISRDGLTLHLSEHHGDGTPGTTVFVPVTGIRDWQQELAAKAYGYARPGGGRRAVGPADGDCRPVRQPPALLRDGRRLDKPPSSRRHIEPE